MALPNEPVDDREEDGVMYASADDLATSAEYTGANIEVLEGLKAVRRRPGMYIGNTDVYGLHHMVYELVDNSVDEALAGHADRIEVVIHPDSSVTVSDNGRGIPVDLQPQLQKSALEVVMTILHAGGKFGGGGYKVSSGLHGVGASVVNALSEWLRAEVRKDGGVYVQEYIEGVPVEPVKRVRDTVRGVHGVVHVGDQRGQVGGQRTVGGDGHGRRRGVQDGISDDAYGYDGHDRLA